MTQSKIKMIENLNTLYCQAIEQENVTVALKIIELQAKLEGHFTPSKTRTISIKELTDIELEAMIKELENG